MGMKLHDIYDVMDRFEQSGIARLKLTYDGVELELDRSAAPAAGAAAPIVVAAPAPGMVPPAPVAAPEAAANVASAPEVPVAAPAEEGLFITAPLVGTFYAAPAPDKDPYVQPGDAVKKGDTVCLLEAMKMMSEVTAPCDCVIEEIMVADGELCSFGAPLIRYREQ